LNGNGKRETETKVLLRETKKNPETDSNMV